MSTEISFWISLIQVSHPGKKRVFRYLLHKLIWQAFPSYLEGTTQPFLFSITDKADANGIYCYVQSSAKPDWTIPMQIDRKKSIQINLVYGVKSISFPIEINDKFAFHLQACPTKNVFQGYKKRGIKTPITKHQDIDKWFMRKSELQGFRVLQYEVFNQRTLVRKEEYPNANEVSLASCQFNGLLKITDTEKFKKTISYGIGPKKIFGFGMMKLTQC